MNQEFAKWDVAFQNGYEQFFASTLANDVEGMALGIDGILSIFNRNCRFRSLEEFDIFFNNPDAVLTL